MSGQPTKRFRYGDRRLRATPVDDEWRVYEEVWTGCQWRIVGHELVETVAIEG